MSHITHSVFKRAENFDKRVHMDSPAVLHSGRDVKRASEMPFTCQRIGVL
ncbi:hypothetical protein [Caballeronia sp. SBC2]|nr:hypothetical protein [Caballeronia sp. SBC2]QIE30315.1 hypothetical protein SBC2_83920 [Caballeronia sp. SBC2]QIE30358.1 hypothetical protein SBC2_84350 [Caballeronia sp. SBC2]